MTVSRRSTSPLTEAPSSPVETADDPAYVDGDASDSDYGEELVEEPVRRGKAPVKRRQSIHTSSLADHVDPMEPGDGRFVPGHTDNGDLKPYLCIRNGCSKSFARKSDLIRHVRIHNNSRPFVCNFQSCQKAFIQRSALTVHLRTHTGERPHVCEICSRAFSDSSSLSRHRRTHTGAKPYTCGLGKPACERSFARKNTLTKHRARDHPECTPPPNVRRRRGESDSLSPTHYSFGSDIHSSPSSSRRIQPRREATKCRTRGDEDGVDGDDDGDFDASHAQHTRSHPPIVPPTVAQGGMSIFAPMPQRVSAVRSPENMFRTTSNHFRRQLAPNDSGVETEDASVMSSCPFFPRTMSLPPPTGTSATMDNSSSMTSIPSTFSPTIMPIVAPGAPRIPQGAFPRSPFHYAHDPPDFGAGGDSPYLGYGSPPMRSPPHVSKLPARASWPGPSSSSLQHIPGVGSPYLAPDGQSVALAMEHDPSWDPTRPPSLDAPRYPTSDIARGLGFRPASPRRTFSPVSSSRTIIRRDSYEVVNTQYSGYAPWSAPVPSRCQLPPLLEHPDAMMMSASHGIAGPIGSPVDQGGAQRPSLFGAVLDAQPSTSYDRYPPVDRYPSTYQFDFRAPPPYGASPASFMA